MFKLVLNKFNKYKMDPRPYHFEFRKPRFANPTFQSNNLYDSMYQLNNMKTERTLQKNPESYRYKNAQNKKPQSEPDTVKRNQSMQLPKHEKIQMIRYPSKMQMNSQSKEKVFPALNVRNGSKLSNYGYNLMKTDPIGQTQSVVTVDQKQVFDKQQHAFDIINYRPTQYRARLKMFPKLTLEDKINERYGSPLKQNN